MLRPAPPGKPFGCRYPALAPTMRGWLGKLRSGDTAAPLIPNGPVQVGAVSHLTSCWHVRGQNPVRLAKKPLKTTFSTSSAQCEASRDDLHLPVPVKRPRLSQEWPRRVWLLWW